ncbi:MAG TPA: hypothetical protein VFL98_00430 [Candidatus Paceibacterota bacterium]|nr:hypothetical protein [Candidatus Paceibacterota bacterium]
MSLPTLALDLDDSLVDFQRAFLAYHNGRFGTAVTYEGISSYSLHLVYGCTEDEMHLRCAEFHLHHSREVEVLPDAAEALSLLREHYRLVVVTARSDFLQEATVSVIERHFPGTISAVRYTGRRDDGRALVPKSQVCIEEEAVALIDDALHNAADAAHAGISAYLFDRPWNQEPPVRGVTRVSSWSEVLAHLLPTMPAR